ncbi:LrgB family protein [Geopseudomonas guangdongensis]|uniref:TIGR00659 family protein n=1 Tax=Geopseudomonas guangdongensis TaxID=1245526 RepID=A0A1H2E911_9GAMM|nr:LrgB family protein [Pseudomonas guangdongensis]SDT91641.1 TIGR00659 family protein [Pseudomonas guangdongensis]
MTAIWTAIVGHPLFVLGLTLLAYQLALELYQRSRWLLAQPVLVATLLLVGALWACGIGYPRYRQESSLLWLLLGPATVALAVPLQQNLPRIRQLFWPVTIALLVGGTITVALTLGLAALFGADREMLMSLAPKSVTSPIAIALAEQMGGIPALTAVFVMITGVLGAVLGPLLLDRAGVTSPAARGLSLGLSAHAIGTAQALQEHPEAGGFAALAMSLAGAFSALALPLLLG